MRHHFSYLGLALEVRILTDTLIELVEKPKREPSTKPYQLLLFPVDIETRERFEQLAQTFDACIIKNDSRSWRELEFLEPEMFEFVHYHKDVEWEPIIQDMLAISRGEPLGEDKYLHLIEFFDGVERRALHLNCDPERYGGCFG